MFPVSALPGTCVSSCQAGVCSCRGTPRDMYISRARGPLMAFIAQSPCSIHKRGFIPQHQQLPCLAATPVAQTRHVLLIRCPDHIHSQKGSERMQPPRSGVSSSSAAAAAAAAAAAEPAPQQWPRQGLRGVQDIVQAAFMYAVVVLVLIVSSTLASGGGLQVWRCLQALHAQGIEAATRAELIGLVITVAGGVWLAVTLVLSFAQAAQEVKELRQELKQQELRQELKQQELRQELKQQQQELRQELKQQLLELRQELQGDLRELKRDLVLDRAYDKRLEAVEAAVHRRAGTQQSST